MNEVVAVFWEIVEQKQAGRFNYSIRCANFIIAKAIGI